jgi:cobalt-zinc-cadmium resistance protein CzcA
VSQGRRRLVVGVNVEGRDLGGFVKEAQELIAKNVELPQGYNLQWGGQFENMQRAMARLMIIIPLTILAIFFLLFMLFKSLRLAALIILVLPFASIGGVFGLFFAGEVFVGTSSGWVYQPVGYCSLKWSRADFLY